MARLNFGVVTLKSKRVCVTVGFLTHTFTMALPELKINLTDTKTLRNDSDCDMRCARVTKMWNSKETLTITMRFSVVSLIEKICNLVPNMEQPSSERQRQTRGLANFVGNALSYLFGTSTTADVEGLGKDLASIKALAGMAVADADRTRKGVAFFTAITNQRLDNMRTVLETEHKSLKEMSLYIGDSRETSEVVAFIA